MRVLTLASVCGVVLAGGLTAAPVPKDRAREQTTEEKLAGKWKLVKTDAALANTYDFIIEYKPKGEMSFTRAPRQGGEPSVSPGKYTVINDGKIEWTVNEGGDERGEASKITLTENKLVLVDPDGLREEFERVVEKPKKDGK